MKINAHRLAELYGIDRRTVTNWVNSTPPCPSTMEGRLRWFDTVAVAAWREEQAAAKARAEAAATKAAPADLDEAKRRYETARADLEELKLAQLRRLLLHVDDVARDFDHIAQGLRAALLSFPATWADRLGACQTTVERQLMLADAVAELMPLLEQAATADGRRAA